MARRAICIIYMMLLLVLLGVPTSEALPVRYKEEFDPRIMPIVTDSSVVTVNTPVPGYKPDPLENIGVELSNGVLIEGDIIIRHVAPTLANSLLDLASHPKSSSDHMRISQQPRNAMILEGDLWSEKVIPYEIDPDFNSTEKQTILNAMDEVTSSVNRCIQFVPREKQDDFIYIDGHTYGCQSHVGKIGGNQSISISRKSRCVSKGIIMHELLHALGLWHEHSRNDRDAYIEIIFHNVRADHLNDFVVNNNYKILTPYDYYSIMHYKTNQFSKYAARYDTIRIKQPGIDDTKVGQREHLSDLDKEKINILYTCRKTLRTAVDNNLNSWQSGLVGDMPKPTTTKLRSTLDAVDSGRGNVIGEGLAQSMVNKNGIEPEVMITPSKPTIHTNMEVVSETVLKIPTRTIKQDMNVHLNHTETAEIGKK